MQTELGSISVSELAKIVDLVRGSTGQSDSIDVKGELYVKDYSIQRQFLLELGLLRQTQNQYYLSEDLALEASGLPDIRSFVARALCRDPNPYASDLQDFIGRFRYAAASFRYLPSTAAKLTFAGLRNLLQELEVLSQDDSSGEYILDTEFTYYFLANKRGQDIDTLLNDLENQRELGQTGEEIVLAYEKKRLSSLLASASHTQIEHTSQVNVSAGYDIRSWTYCSKSDEYIPRYIEVKVTSHDTFQFYWTRNEIAAAKLLGSRYFLYLLPTKLNVGPHIDNLLIVEDPYTTIYQTTDWLVETEVCRVIRQ